MRDPTDERARLVRDLVEHRRDPQLLLQELRRFGWDSEVELAELRPRHVRHVLDGYLNDELSARDVEAWADAVEVREDIEFVSDAVVQAIFVLATPAAEGPLTRDRAAELIESLPEAPET